MIFFKFELHTMTYIVKFCMYLVAVVQAQCLQQNRVCRSVKTVHINLFAQYRKLHKFATTNSNFEKKRFF